MPACRSAGPFASASSRSRTWAQWDFRQRSKRRRSSADALPRRLAGSSQRLGQPPIDDERFAVLAQHDVARLQVAMQNAAAVGIVDRLAHVDQALQEPPELQVVLGGIARPGPAVSGAWNFSIASLRLRPRMNRIA